jgi:hypothetical protein
VAERFKTKPKILFGPGRFRAEGGEWVDKSEADVAEMLLNFRELAARGEYPSVTKGHPKDSAAPKYGELCEAWVDPAGNRIVGPLDMLPGEFAQSVERGEYDKVSIVFLDHWWDPVSERFRDNVITEVGILGAKWGAYKAQDALEFDHTALAEGGGDGVVRYRLSMADVETTKALNSGGGEDVEDKERKELLATIEELRTKIAELEAAAPDEEKDALEAKVADLTEKLELATKAGAQGGRDRRRQGERADAPGGGQDPEGRPDVDGRLQDHQARRGRGRRRGDNGIAVRAGVRGHPDGVETMASPFEQACEAIRQRPVVLKLAEKGVDDSDPLHKGKEKEKKSALSEMDIEIAKKCGLDPDEVERVNAEGYDPHADVAAAEAKRAEKN